jgi:hypothetical protein
MHPGERHWRAGVTGFVLAQLPPRPARVLEIGCGDSGEIQATSFRFVGEART